MFDKSAPYGAFFIVMQSSFKRLCALAIGGVGLAGCQGLSPVTDTLVGAYQKVDHSSAYRQGLSYLSVSVDGHQAAMALGAQRHDGHRLHQHWYSGQREMLYLVDGRIHEVMGMTHELRAQTPLAPTWEDLQQSAGPKVWSRTLDVQPGYRYGVMAYVVTQQISPTPSKKLLADQNAIWFEERISTTNAQGRPWNYTQVFAWHNQQVVYSEQCIAPDVCMVLKPLGVMRP